MVAFLLEHRQMIGIAILALWALMTFGGSLGGFFTRLRTMLPAVQSTPSALAAPGSVGADPIPVIRQLKKRFKGNAEVEAAVKVVWTALLEDAGS